MADTLPMPDADALAHSALLRDVIAEQVLAAGGSLPFWKFMELALYAPGLGYYSAGAHKFGPDGDFITAPELSPLYSACVADALTPVLRQLGPEALFVEVGGGSGAFAETCLAKLLANDALPAESASRVSWAAEWAAWSCATEAPSWWAIASSARAPAMAAGWASEMWSKVTISGSARSFGSGASSPSTRWE